jgi:CRISPR-associated protein Csd1
MLLQKLKEYAEQRLDIRPRLYNEVPVRYFIELDAEGRLRNPSPVDTADASDKATRRGLRRLAPNVTRSMAITPFLLADHAEYTFGLAREKSDPSRTARCHEDYMTLLRKCAVTTEEPAVMAVLRFLERDPVAELLLPADFDRGEAITFRVEVNGELVLPTDLPSVQAFWAGEADRAGAGAVEMQCVVCGQQRAVLDRLQQKVKGVLGGQTSGTSIIAANAPAFESYGLEASLIAPTCADCAERFSQGVNALIAGPRSHLYIGDATFIFWTREAATDDDFYTLLDNPTPDTVGRLLSSAASGRPVTGVEPDRFYAASLTASGGRTVVRDWIDTTVNEANGNLARWFERQRIVDWDNGDTKPLSIKGLCGAVLPAGRTGFPDYDRLPRPVPRTMLRGALAGSPLPFDLLFRAVPRIRAEREVRHRHAALIKLVLLSQSTSQEEAPVSLNPDHPDTAYQCGRLLAVLERAQRLAMPNVKNTIVDRFFGTASSAPATVFGRLVRGAQPHLSVLETSNPGAHVNIQKELEEVSSHISAFPSTLTLRQQGLFALGYYHQRAHRASRPTTQEPQED